MNQKKINILLVAKDKGLLSLQQALAVSGAEITRCDGGRSAEELICKNNYAAVAVDANLADGNGLYFVRQWAREYPLVNFALVSDLSAGDFHETTEGLGVFMQLSSDSDEEEAGKMLEILRKINGLLQS